MQIRLRRIGLASKLNPSWGANSKHDIDPALVRHVYDVYRIGCEQPQEIDAATQVFPAIVTGDAEEYRGQFPSFYADPIGALRSTLEQARTNGILRKQYDQKVLPLIYGGERTAFETAFTAFEGMANQLIATL